jgi:hypothetical protein
MSPLYREDLEAMCCEGCGRSDCGVVPTPRCHPKARTVLKYFKGSGQIQINCVKCGRLVADIAVAAQAPAPASEKC